MRKENISFIDYTDEPDPILCPFCIKVNVKVKLVPHYYDIHGRDLIDPDNFLQCPINGNHLIPLQQGKIEVEYGPIIGEDSLVQSVYESGSEFKSVEHRKKKKRTPRNQKHEVDKDMAAEHGTVNILYDSQGNY